MIKELLGVQQNGIYAAAVRISTLFYALVPLLSWSLQTAFVNAKKQSHTLYIERLRLLGTFVSIISYSIIIIILFFSDKIIYLLFGESYSEASNILVIHAISIVFVYNRVIRSIYILNESYFKFALISNIIGAIVNVVANFIFLEHYGIISAALTTCISYMLAYTVSGLFYKKTREIAIIQIKSILLLDIKFFITRIYKGIF